MPIKYPKGKKPPMEYAVVRQVHGGQRTMMKTKSYKKALSYFHQHPRAYGIQKYRGEWTAGLIQPTIPSKLKVKGKTFIRGYTGGGNKKTAEALAKGFKKSGHDSFARKSKHGWHVFVHFDQRKLK